MGAFKLYNAFEVILSFCEAGWSRGTIAHQSGDLAYAAPRADISPASKLWL